MLEFRRSTKEEGTEDARKGERRGRHVLRFLLVWLRFFLVHIHGIIFSTRTNDASIGRSPGKVTQASARDERARLGEEVRAVLVRTLPP